VNQPCTGCGILAPEGTRGCRAMFDELAIRQWYSPLAYPVRRMMVDTYALQHPDEFCASAKSFAAHWTGLCAALEHAGHPNLLRVLLEWLDAQPALVKPQLPAQRGRVTIVDTYQASCVEEVHATADRWARSVWQAYEGLQPQARTWVAEALARPPARRPARR
jgi:hypothetical protein